MQLIFIHGPAACGKLTVSKQLAPLIHYRLFHNHLTVDLVSALFDFGSEPFNRLRESIWLECFADVAEQDQSILFTFQPEASVAEDFPQRVVSVIEAAGGQVIFIELTCPEPEIERRLESKDRARYGKLRNLEVYRQLRDAGAFEYPPLPKPALSLDTGKLSPREAARQIAGVIRGE